MSQMELKLSTPDRRILKNLASAVEKLAAELARSRPQQTPSQVKLNPETIRRISEAIPTLGLLKCGECESPDFPNCGCL